MFREEATYFEACLMHRYLTIVRSRALKVMLSAYTQSEKSVVQVPLKGVCQRLCFESEEECDNFLTSYGIKTLTGRIVEFSRLNYEIPDTWPVPHRLPSIMTRKQNRASNSELINGGPISVHYVLKPPSSSFDSNGRFVGSQHYRELLINLLDLVQNKTNSHSVVEKKQAIKREKEQSECPGVGEEFHNEATAVNWPPQQNFMEQRQQEINKKKNLEMCAERITAEIVDDVIGKESKELMFGICLAFKKMLGHGDLIMEALLLEFVKEFCHGIASDVLTLHKQDVTLKNNVTSEILNSVICSIVSQLITAEASDVHLILVTEGCNALESIIEEVINAESLELVSYWGKLKSASTEITRKVNYNLLEKFWLNWKLSTIQASKLRKYSNRPFPPGPSLSLAQAVEESAHSSKVLKDGTVVRFPLVSLSKFGSPLYHPEEALASRLKAALQANETKLSHKDIVVPEFEDMLSLTNGSLYPCKRVWKLVVVLPANFRQNQYILCHVKAIFQACFTTTFDRCVSSICLVSFDKSNETLKLEECNLPDVDSSNIFKGAVAVLVLDEVFSYNKSTELLRGAISNNCSCSILLLSFKNCCAENMQNFEQTLYQQLAISSKEVSSLYY